MGARPRRTVEVEETAEVAPVVGLAVGPVEEVVLEVEETVALPTTCHWSSPPRSSPGVRGHRP